MNNFSIGTPVNLAPTGIASFAKCPICLDLHHTGADIAVLGAPFDLAIQGRTGTRLGPRGIRAASTRFSYKPGGSYDPERDEMYLDTNRWTIVDCGDVDYVPGDLETTFQNLTQAVRLLTEQGTMPVILGGDHSVTYPAILGMEAAGPFDIIHFDAHADLRQDYLGMALSHACVLRRCHDLVGDGRIHQFCIRSGEREEFAFARSHTDFHPFTFDGLADLTAQLAQSQVPVYLTIDLDCLDPSVFPGTGTPEAGGVTFLELLEAIRRFEHVNVVGADVNELAPMLDASGVSTATACKVLRELLLTLSHGEG